MTLSKPHPTHVLSMLALLAGGCGSSHPAPSAAPASPPSIAATTAPSAAEANPAPAELPAAPLVASKVDSVGPHPRPTVLIPGQNNFAVRTKLVPRVIGNGWVLMVNKTDSLEFLRPADSTLTSYLFGVQPSPNMRLRLRFILKPEGDGTRISLMGHLVGRDGQLPYVAQEAPLVENLNSLQAALVAAPPMQPPEKPGKKNKK